MATRRRSRLSSIIVSLAIAWLMASQIHASVKGDIHETFKVGEGGLLTLEADLGSIEVQASRGNTVDVEVLFRPRSGSMNRMRDFLDDFDVDIRHRGDDVTVIAEYTRGYRNFWNSIGRYVRVEFRITVPERYNVDLRTSGGSITVDDLEGEVDSRTSGGSLEFGHIKGPVYGKTSGGSIRLDGCDGRAEVRTSGGSITIGKVAGDVRAHTSGGSIHVEEVFGSIQATTSGGSVTARISQQPEDDCRLTTSGGTVTVYMDKDVQVDLDASTSGGRVRNELPILVQGSISKRSLYGRINGGGPELYLRTSGGSIYIREL